MKTVYVLSHCKSTPLLTIKRYKGNDINESQYPYLTEVCEYEYNQFISYSKSKLIGKANEIRQAWIAETQARLDDYHNLKIYDFNNSGKSRVIKPKDS